MVIGSVLNSLPSAVAVAEPIVNFPVEVGASENPIATYRLIFPLIFDWLLSWFGPDSMVKLLKEGGVILSMLLAFYNLNWICNTSFLPIFLLGQTTENFTCP
jgi:hypothetical protein